MLFRSSDDRSNESRPLRRGTAACAQEAIERRGERWMTDSSAARERSRMRVPAPALARPVPRTRTRAPYPHTHVPTYPRTRVPTYPRTHTRTAPRCRFPSQISGFATESGISMGKRGGRREGSRGEEGGHAERRAGTRGNAARRHARGSAREARGKRAGSVREACKGERDRDAVHAATALGHGTRPRYSPTALAHGTHRRHRDHRLSQTRVRRHPRSYSGQPPVTSDARLPPDSPHGQSRRDVPYATTPSIATRSWLTAWE